MEFNEEQQEKIIRKAISEQFPHNENIIFQYEQWDPENKQQQLDKKLDRIIADETDVMLKHMYQEWQTINPPLGLNELANQRDMINKLELRIKELERKERGCSQEMKEYEQAFRDLRFEFNRYIKRAD